MFSRICQLACMAALVTGCAGGDVPGLFYFVQLQEAQESTVCMALAHEVTAALPLSIVDQAFPTRPKGECIVSLHNQGSPAIFTTLLWDPTSRRFSIRVVGPGPARTSATQELAGQIIAIARRRYPEAIITTYQPRYTLLGP
jgi:hypothetical protein